MVGENASRNRLNSPFSYLLEPGLVYDWRSTRVDRLAHVKGMKSNKLGGTTTCSSYDKEFNFVIGLFL